jgi:hypothetical protein
MKIIVETEFSHSLSRGDFLDCHFQNGVALLLGKISGLT